MSRQRVLRMPLVSTAHLTPGTCGQLDRWCETIDLSRHDLSQCPTAMAATDYGWLVFCTEDTTGFPPDLRVCIAWARQRGCDYILFDADGDEIDVLPKHGGPAEHTPLTKEGRPSE